MSRARWVGVWRAVSERRDVWWEGNGAEAMGDWIVANMVEGVSEVTVRTASSCSVEEVDAHKDAFASKYGWRYAGSEAMCKMFM